MSKLEERVTKIDTQLAKLRKQEQVDGYKEKVGRGRGRGRGLLSASAS